MSFHKSPYRIRLVLHIKGFRNKCFLHRNMYGFKVLRKILEGNAKERFTLKNNIDSCNATKYILRLDLKEI